MPRDFLIQTVGQSWIKCCSPAGIRGKLLTLDGLSSADNNHALAKVVMMFEIFGRAFRNCDGVSRRDVLKVGMLAAGGLALPDILRRKARAARAGRQVTHTAVIQIFCGGGPSHSISVPPTTRPPTATRKASVTRSRPPLSAAFQQAWISADASAAPIAAGGT